MKHCQSMLDIDWQVFHGVLDRPKKDQAEIDGNVKRFDRECLRQLQQ